MLRKYCYKRIISILIIFFCIIRKPRSNDPKFVRVVDFGVGNYSSDYTGHAFIGSYLYNQQQYLLNTTFELSNNWLRPAQPQINNPLQQTQAKQQQQYIQPQLQQQQQLRYYLTPQEQQALHMMDPNYKMDFDFLIQNSIPIYNWDPLVDNEKTNFNYRLQDNEMKLGFDQWYANVLAKNNELYKRNNPDFINPFALPNVRYIDSYKFAKVWWNNESAFINNKQEYVIKIILNYCKLYSYLKNFSYVFRLKPDYYYHKFVGAKYEGGTTNTPPYYWCFDPTTWLSTVMTPIWATNDYDYKNKVFLSHDHQRFVGLSEVVLNFEEVDINQCPGDRQMNAFSSTALCDSTTQVNFKKKNFFFKIQNKNLKYFLV